MGPVMLGHIDQRLRQIVTNEPFGGLAVVLCGDFVQLGPAVLATRKTQRQLCFLEKSCVHEFVPQYRAGAKKKRKVLYGPSTPGSRGQRFRDDNVQVDGATMCRWRS